VWGMPFVPASGRTLISKSIFWTLALGLVSVLAVIKYFVSFSPEARVARDFLREMPAEQISEIRLMPYSVLSLTDHDIVIRDRESINRIAGLFRGMPSHSPNHPSARWVAFIQFQVAERQYGGQVEATSNQGSLFWFTSSVRGGWNYGCYRNDALGPYLEQLVAGEAKSPKR